LGVTLKGRIRELDGLRAIAVLMVVAWHYVPAGDGDIAGGGMLYTLFRPGRSGVDLFFVLSGFLITSILIEQRGAPSYYTVFYLRRAFRILPVYALMVLALFLGRALAWKPELFGGEFPVWTYPFFLQNFAMAHLNTYGPAFMTATWSLAIEEQFYLVFPFLVAVIPARALPKLLVSLLVLVPILRALNYWHSGAYLPVYVLTPFRADTLAIGALIAWAFSVDGVKTRLIANASKVRWLLLSLAAAAPLLWGRSAATFSIHMGYWGHTYLTLLFGTVLLAVLTHQNSPWLWLLRSRLAYGVAAISYALYLFHLPVLELLEIEGLSRPSLPLAAFGVSIALSALSYFLIERPCLRFGRHLAYTPAPIPKPDVNSVVSEIAP
jgi:peptidoglycan/LPS O-acetylase OafA/YrhL